MVVADIVDLPSTSHTTTSQGYDSEISEFDSYSDSNSASQHNYAKGYILTLIESLNTQIRDNQSKVFGAVEPIFEYASKMMILEMAPYIDMIKKAYFLIFFMFAVLFILVTYLLFQIRHITVSVSSVSNSISDKLSIGGGGIQN